jgi:hypothetical protein
LHEDIVFRFCRVIIKQVRFNGGTVRRIIRGGRGLQAHGLVVWQSNRLEILYSNAMRDCKRDGIFARLGWGNFLLKLTLVNELVECPSSRSDLFGDRILSGRSCRLGKRSGAQNAINIFVCRVVHCEDLRKSRCYTKHPILKMFLGWKC